MFQKKNNDEGGGGGGKSQTHGTRGVVSPGTDGGAGEGGNGEVLFKAYTLSVIR